MFVELFRFVCHYRYAVPFNLFYHRHSARYSFFNNRIIIECDFSSLKDYMTRGGLVMQTFRCPNCSAPVEFPEKGKTTKCAHCGTKIYARDLFEKIKELIG